MGLFSGLRRQRPRVPFWQLQAHRIPTLWTLYRGLLSHSPGPAATQYIKFTFYKYKHLTSPASTTVQLTKLHKLLDEFKLADNGDDALQQKLARWEMTLRRKEQKRYWFALLREDMRWREYLRKRPYPKGSIMRATIYNKPMMRLVNQPAHISKMIHHRRVARVKRGERNELYGMWMDDMKQEATLEQRLLKEIGLDSFRPIYHGSLSEWLQPYRDARMAISDSFKLEAQRASTPMPPELVAAAKAAKREKSLNKQREKQRELRGEVLPRTLKRRRKRPPAHIQDMMSERQLALDIAARGVGEVGYVGKAKRALGFKLKRRGHDPEVGAPENQEWLRNMEADIARENERRRLEATSEDPTLRS